MLDDDLERLELALHGVYRLARNVSEPVNQTIQETFGGLKR